MFYIHKPIRLNVLFLLILIKLSQEAGVQRHEIDEVVLVGGTSRLLKLRDMISEFFGGKELNIKIDPDVAVAYGAALVY